MSRAAVSQHEMRKLYNVLHRVFSTSQQTLPVLAVSPAPPALVKQAPAKSKRTKIVVAVAVLFLVASAALFVIWKRRGKAAQKAGS